jgi:hypothetical protein
MTLNDVLIESAKLPYQDRRGRIRQCVEEGRHRWDALPSCVASSGEKARYCDQCWSVIDREGHTWSWPPAETVSA